MDLNLAGKTVIVTGGGSNIGRGIVLAFAKENSNIVIAEVDEAQGQKVAAEAKALGSKVMCIKTDATDFDSVTATIKRTLEEFGQIDVLVNNVGWGTSKPFHKKPVADWDKELDLNLRSTLNCTKAVVNHMIERKYGKIVNISSAAGRMGGFMISIYAAGKGGVIAFTKALATELGPRNINVNVVCPGVTFPREPGHAGKLSMWADEMAKVWTPEAIERDVQSTPLRRVGNPEDIASITVFLASDAASFITGQTISVDGGYTMM